MIQLKEILHLYLGCPVKHSSFKTLLELKTVGVGGITLGGFSDDAHYGASLDQIQLILRPLSDMTEDECKTIGLEKIYKEITSKEISGQGFVWKSGEIIHLLKWGFDLFGLIESNQAVNKLTL